jgi:hypothetical protein
MLSLRAETALAGAPTLGHDHEHGQVDGRPLGHSHDHDHDHDPGRAHSHDAPVEAGEPPQGGPVMLDIGGDIGALIAYCEADQFGYVNHGGLAGEIRTTHTGVW